MKPVEPRHDSDCVAACIATLLELPIEAVPDFWPRSGSALTQAELVRRWLAARGYHWYYSTYGGYNCPRVRDFVAEKRESASTTFPPRGYWIAQISSVDRLRDGDPNHVIVMRDRKVVFNPGGTVKEAHGEPWFLIGYYLLVPLDPSKLAIKE